MKRFLLTINLLIVGLFQLAAQNPGDTIVVKAMDYSTTTRDVVVQFPTTNANYHKIIMAYNMRCKDGQISDGNNRNKGCGEWDYSCNTYIHDSSHVDSIVSSHPNYIISKFSGTAFDYVNNPIHHYYQHVQKGVTIDSTISEKSAAIGAGTMNLDRVFHTDTHAGKSQYLFTASELTSGGLSAGTLDGITLDVSSNPVKTAFLRVRLKQTSATALTDTMPDFDGFTEVYYHNNTWVTGTNRLQFYTPFSWNGTSNIIVELSFTNKAPDLAMNFKGATGTGLSTSGDAMFDFDGTNYIQVYGYKGVTGSDNRTIEAWVKTTGTLNELISWGSNASGQKWLIRVDGNGKMRVELNNGSSVGSTVINDDMWHHIAVVLDGNNAQDIDMYVDGVKESISSATNKVINTASNFDFRISKGFHNKPNFGSMANVRVWKKALSGNEIANWMYKKVDASHPSYADLDLALAFNDGSGTMINDHSVHARHGSVINAATWNNMNGLDHFKNVEMLSQRPNMTFYQGSYNLTVSNDTIVDTVQQDAHLVNQYQVYSKAGTIYTDSIGLISSQEKWQATTENLYDPQGNVISSTPVTADGTINISNLSYFTRNPSKFEIMSFVTPYGIGLDMGQNGETWYFDVTDFEPILKGKKRLTMERGGQFQEQMDIQFFFIEGTPPAEVMDIQQIWRVDYKSYSVINDNTFFEPRDVMMNANGASFKIRSSITGHGQEGEFIPRIHWVDLDGGSKEFSWQVWKECAYNPVYPQGGTWVYDRAGWCPGMATDIQHFDITSNVTAGSKTTIDYGLDLGSQMGTSNYIVSHQLVTYGPTKFNLDAAIDEIITPSSRVEYRRESGYCNGPVIIIKNTGATTLTSLEIEYWVNNAPTPETYTWTGSLEFMEREEVRLPAMSTLWDAVNGSHDEFHVRVLSPNGGSDEYAHNNEMMEIFEIPEILPSSFYIEFKTNNKGFENEYKVINQFGQVVFSKNGLASNVTYRDTMNLGIGCYRFIMTDSGQNGISWWAAPNDGSGQVRFRDVATKLPVKDFNGDFGAEIDFQFTVDKPLDTKELENAKSEIYVYPNPASSELVVRMPNEDEVEVQVFNGMGQLLDVSYKTNGNERIFNTSDWARGVIYIHISTNERTSIKKIVLI